MTTQMTKLLFALLLGAFAAQAETRTWTSIAGTTIEAEFVKLEGNTVVLKTPDGATKEIASSKLIKSDRMLALEMGSPFAAKKAAERAAIRPPQRRLSPYLATSCGTRTRTRFPSTP